MDHQEEENIDDEPAPVMFEPDIGSGERTEGERETLEMVLQIPVQGADQPPPLRQERESTQAPAPAPAENDLSASGREE